MITVDVQPGGLVAVDDDGPGALYEPAEVRRARLPAQGHVDSVEPVRALVEVQRRFGGLAPRALIGGQFTPAPGTEVLFEVNVGAPFDELPTTTCESRLWKQPFSVGLPAEFADAVLHALADAQGLELPSGTLTVDRAGFDEIESSAAIFAQAAAVLRQVLVARMHSREIEPEVRAVVSTW